MARLREDFRQTPSVNEKATNKRFPTLAQLFQEFEGLSSEAALFSWKVFVYPKLVFDSDNTTSYKDIDTAECTVIAIYGAQAAGCLNMEAGGKFAEFDLDDQTRSLLKELPALISPECLETPCQSKLKRLEDLVRSILGFTDTEQERTKYQRITEELANTMVVQGSRAAEYMDMTICALQTIFADVLQVSTPVTRPYWDFVSWPKVDPMGRLRFGKQYMEIMKPLCVAAMGSTAALTCRGRFEHMRPATATTECFHVCRSNPEDTESVFVMVPIVHPGRLRYNVGSTCTQKLAQLQWCLFFILTDAVMAVVKETTQHQEFSITKRSTMVSEILRNAETPLHTDAGRSLLTEIR